MKVGAFGNVVFEVSSWKILTFDDFKKTVKHNYAEHKILNGKPILESVGQELIEIAMKILLNRNLGVDVKTEISKLERMCQMAESNFLIIGSESMGLFVIESLEEGVQHFDGAGNFLSVEVAVKFKEYVN